jgi:hypothetical protein
MKQLDRKDKIDILKKLTAGQPIDEYLPKRDHVFISREGGISEVGTGKIIDPASFEDYIAELRKRNPLIKINPIIIQITRGKI